jgi:four helix bundle protein
VGARHYWDLEAWQLADALKKIVFALIEHSAARRDREFCDQIRNAASSAPANLAEGFGAYRHPEFARYARIARASLHETHHHLADGADRRYWSADEARDAQKLADRAIGATTRLVRYWEQSDTPDWRK